MSFSDLKKKSNSSIETLTQKLLESDSNQYSPDPRFWVLERDKTGNAYAVIRFLPSPNGEDLPWAKYYSHGFKGPGGLWYVEDCPTTIGGKCPVCEANSKLWNSGLESDKKIARDRKRRISYISNILVISDASHPECEGKNYLFRYGTKIFDKIKESMQPQFQDEKPIDPFNLWTGRNFKLKIRTVDGYPNYDKSEFEASGPLNNDDKVLENIWKSEYSLKPFADVSKFKSYDVLAKRFSEVMGSSLPAVTSKEMPTETEEKPPFVADKSKSKANVDLDDDESALNYFKRLKND